MLGDDDKERRSELRQSVHDHLLEIGKLGAVEGMALDGDWLEGQLLRWVLRVKLKDGDVLTHHMLNEDGAPVLLDGLDHPD